MEIFKRSLRAQLTLILLIVALPPLIIIGLASYQQVSSTLQNAALREAKMLNRLSAQEIESILPQIKADLLSLRETPAIQSLMRLHPHSEVDTNFSDTYAAWVSGLNSTFVGQLEHKKLYHQLRFIDRMGQEVARVRYDGQQTRVVPAQALQNDKNEMYFAKTADLDVGQVYVSDVSLYQQNGEIVKPYVPLIRYSTPVIGPAGELGGVLVLDVHADMLLERVDTGLGQAYIADQHGAYLLHPETSKTFGNELDTGYNVVQDFPWAMSQLTGLDYFVGANHEMERVMALQKIYYDPMNRDHYWLLIRSLPEETILADLNTWHSKILLLISGSAASLVLVAFGLARSITYPVSMLTKASEYLAEGQWDTQLPVERQDEIGRLSTCFQDMSDRLQQSIEVLTESEARYRAISELTSDYVYSLVVKPDGKTYETHQPLSWNTQTFYEFISYDEVEYQERGGWVALIHPDDRKHFQSECWQAIETGKPAICEYRIVTKTGEIRWLRDHWRPQRDEANGPVTRILGAVSDITAKKEAEAEREVMLHKLLRLTTIIENTSDFVGLSTLDGDMLYVNPAGLVMIGRSMQGYSGLHASDLMVSGSFDKFEAEILPILLEKEVWEGYIEFQHVDGHIIPTTQVLVLIRDDAGEPIGIGGISRDITDIKRAKMELQAAKEAAEAANRAKSEFLANMSHELRTPLNGILGYAQILQKNNHLSDKQRDGLSTIQRSGEHLLTLINDILDISKVEAGRMELQATDFNLPTMLSNIADMFQLRAEQHGISFSYEQLTDLPHAVCADEKRLRQILINLVGNAVKFTQTGGVALKVGLVQADVLPSVEPSSATENGPTCGIADKLRHKIRFQVEDTGVGIPAEALEEIFLPFQQTGAGRMVEGTGLGLPISKQLVEMMGGQLHVESSIGEGSIFWFEVALSEVPKLIIEEIDTPHQVVGYQGRQRRVLIVDDKSENREVLRESLQPLGFELIEAADGKAAVEQTIRHQPDLILMDIRMPVMDGLEATRQIRQMSNGDEFVIITISASAFEHNRQQSLEAGSTDFLAKPFRQERLLSRIEQYLGLTWIYETEPTASAHDSQSAAISDNGHANGSYVSLSSAEIDHLFELAMRGNIHGILKQAEVLEQTQQQVTPFTTELRQLAKGFKMKELRQLIKQQRESGVTH